MSATTLGNRAGPTAGVIAGILDVLKVVAPTERMAAYVARLAARPAFQRAEAIEAERAAAPAG